MKELLALESFIKENELDSLEIIRITEGENFFLLRARRLPQFAFLMSSHHAGTRWQLQFKSIDGDFFENYYAMQCLCDRGCFSYMKRNDEGIKIITNICDEYEVKHLFARNAQYWPEEHSIEAFEACYFIRNISKSTGHGRKDIENIFSDLRLIDRKT